MIATISAGWKWKKQGTHPKATRVQKRRPSRWRHDGSKTQQQVAPRSRDWDHLEQTLRNQVEKGISKATAFNCDVHRLGTTSPATRLIQKQTPSCTALSIQCIGNGHHLQQNLSDHVHRKFPRCPHSICYISQLEFRMRFRNVRAENNFTGNTIDPNHNRRHSVWSPPASPLRPR